MANTILIKRSATPGKVPSIANLSLGELGINTYDGSLYFKKDDGVESIVTVSIVGKTEIFTNKTFNTAGITGNVFQINGTTISAISGTGSTVVLATGPSISNLTLTGTLTAGGSAGTLGQVLQSTATGVQWTAPTPLATITNDTTTNATFYPPFVNATSGNLTTTFVSSTKLTYNPSTGTLSASALSSPSLTATATTLALGATGANSITASTNGSTRLTVDSSGNVGIGVVPSAWVANSRALQILTATSLSQTANGYTNLSSNSYESALDVYKYITNGFSTLHQQSVGQHRWYTAPSGTAGNTITFTQAMTLDANGNLGVGVTPAAKIDVLTTGGRVQLYPAVNVTGTRILSVNTAGAAAAPIEISGTRVLFTNGSNTPVGQFDSNGNLLLGSATSISSSSRLQVTSPNIGVDNGAGGQAIMAVTSDAFATDRGATLGLGGKNSGGQNVAFAAISGRSEGTANAGYLQLCTLNSGGTMSEHVRVDSTGRVGIGTTSFAAANYKLTVSGGYSVLNGLRISGADPANSIYQVAQIGISSDNLITFGTGVSQTERLRIDATGNSTFTGQVISTRANSTADNGGQIYLNGATGNRIDFNTNGVAAPTFTTRSAGTKIVLYPTVNASQVDYAIGVDTATLWQSVYTSAASFKWYAGTTNIATLTGAGNFSTTGTVLGSNITGYSIPDTGGTPSYVLLGTWTTGQAGYTLYINVVSHSGYNADTAQNQVTRLYFKTSNGSSNQGGFYGDALAFREVPLGGNSGSPASFRIVQVSTSSYAVYGSFSSYTSGSTYQLQYPSYTTWTHSGTVVAAPTGTFLDVTPTNYNSFSPTLTGTGASGSWGISVTGSAASLTTTRTLWGQNFNGSGNVTGSLTSVGDITGAGAVTLTATAGALGLVATGANSVTASTNGLTRLTIDSAGLVIIGPGTQNYFNGNQINAQYGNNGNAELAFNYVGYAGGTTQFRDTTIYNGKNGLVARFTGSTNVFSTVGQITSTQANSATTGAGQVYLNGATGNRIDFNTNGIAAPAFVGATGSTRSVGTKIVLYPGTTASQADAAFGIDNGTLWSSIWSSTEQFRWYAGTTNIATLSGAGVLSLATDGSTLYGPNTGWAQYLRVGGNGNADTTNASVVTTNGNLHLDAKAGVSATFINYYKGTGGVNFGNGASGTIGSITSAGVLSVNSTITGTRLISNIATGTAPLAVTSTTVVPNLNVNYLGGNTEVQIAENLRANRNISGGGTITVDASYNVLWSARFIVIANGHGSNFSSTGYFDITCPTSGTITGDGGATNVTATAAGIPLAAWQAIYYILPIGSGNTSLPANFRVVAHTSSINIPSTWVLVCIRNGDNGAVYFNNGIVLTASESMNAIQQDNANTVNTLVRRDASGNFSAGTITAALSGNATTATTATNVSGGSVAAATGAFSTYLFTLGQVRATGWYAAPTGSSYTGLAVEMGMSAGSGYVICYNRDTSVYGTLNIQGSGGSTLISLPATGSTISVTGSISATGSVSGTNITSGGNVTGSSTSCTGNAATTTILQTARSIGGTSFNGSADITPFRASTIPSTDAGVIQTSGVTYAARSASSTPQQYTYGINFEFKNATVVSGTGNYAGLLTLAPYNGTTASTGDPNYQLAFSPAAANSTAIPTLKIRAGIDATWGSWATLLNSSNYNTYAPTLTGTGASGSWGISVTGSSASCTGNAATVTTNANLTGDVTSVGNATSIAAGVIVNADINASAAIADTKLATIATTGKVSNSATTATSANTASAIVARDASGNFSAGTITATTGSFSGNMSFNSGYGSAAVAYGCRAWVNFNGTGLTPTVRGSGNVSSITDNGVGQYTVNLTTAMPDTNYVTFIGAFVQTNGNTNQGAGSIRGTSTKSTTAVGFGIVNFNDTTVADYQEVDVAIFR